MTFRRYEQYKDSGVAWLGEVPAHWAVAPIKRLLQSIEQGWSPQCEGFPAEPGQWGVLKVGCVNGGRFDAEENKALPASLDPIPALAIRRGDVLVSRANTRDLVGSVAVVHEDHDKLLLCDKLYRLRADERRCEPEFLALYLAASAARSVIEAAATGASSSMLNIGQGAIVGMQIALPPHDEQRAMLSFLGVETAKIDALVEEQKRLIELLKEKRQAVISHAVTKGLNPNAPMKDSGVEWLGQVPAQWVVKSIKWISPVLRGASPRPIDDQKYFDDAGEYAWVRIADASASDGLLLETTQRLSSLGSSLSVKLEPGELFVSIAGTVGKPCIAGIKCCIHDGFVYFPRLSIDPKFLFRLFEHGACYAGLGKMGTQLNLNTDTIGSIRIGVPPTDEMHNILRFIEAATRTFDELISEAESAMNLLQERRTALISAAVTGKIDVRRAAHPHG